MIPQRINLFGFSITRTLLLVIVGAVVLFFVLIVKAIGGVWRKVMKMLGLAADEDEPDVSKENQEQILKNLAKNAGVESQMTNGNRIKAEDIHMAINGFGVDMEKLMDTFNTITGPNQMGAVSNFYGIRLTSVAFVMRHTGDLKSTLYWRLTSSQYARVKPKLDLLNLIK